MRVPVCIVSPLLESPVYPSVSTHHHHRSTPVVYWLRDLPIALYRDCYCSLAVIGSRDRVSARQPAEGSEEAPSAVCFAVSPPPVPPGRTLHLEQAGVSCRDGGRFINKREAGFLQEGRPWLLAVEDPNDPENDLARNSYNVTHVRAAFDHAYHELTAPTHRKEVRRRTLYARRAPVPPRRRLPRAASHDRKRAAGNTVSRLNGVLRGF